MDNNIDPIVPAEVTSTDVTVEPTVAPEPTVESSEPVATDTPVVESIPAEAVGEVTS